MNTDWPDDDAPPAAWRALVQRLQARERHLATLVGSARDAIIAIDGRGHITDWNLAAERMLGWTAAEAIGQPLDALIVPPALREAHRAGHARYLATGQSRILNTLVEVPALHRDGHPVLVELSLFRLAGEGQDVAFGAVMRDITQRAAERDALKKSEERYRLLVERLGEGMAVIQDGRVVFANPRALELMQVKPEEAIGASFLTWLHPEDQVLARERQAARQRGEPVPERYEMRRVFADGTVLWMETHATATTWQDRPATMSFFTDVTERREMRAAIERSEQRYRAVIEHLTEGMVVVQNQRLVFANRRAAELVGVPLDQFQNSGFLPYVHPEDQSLVLDRQRRRLAGEEVPPHYEIRLLRPDGRVVWVDIGATALPWDGAPAALVFLSDVSERKRLEAQLQQTLSERETILQSSIVGIAFLTPHGRFRWANEAMHTLFGDAEHKQLTSLESVYLSRAEYLRVGGEVAAAIQQGKPYQAELQMRRLDGETFWVLLSGKAVNPRDLSAGTVWVVMDISQRKALEVALQRSSSEREAMLNTALVGISFNQGRRLQWVNDKYLDICGYSRDELIGQSSRLFYDSDAAFEADGQAIDAALKRDGWYLSERQIQRRDGGTPWVQLAGRCVEGHDPSHGVIWTLLDITQRRQAEEDIRGALAQQRELNELRSRFVAMTSHEFRTPLATILSSAELLRYYLDRLDESERLEVLTSIDQAVRRMTEMLDRVLLIGKVDADMLQFAPRHQALAPICERVVQAVQKQFPAAPHRLELELPTEPLLGDLDDTLLTHALGNLLSNAIKYSPAGGLVCLVASPVGDGRVQIVVSDQGIGIPEAEIHHLFESFHRASNVGHIQGTGLGLAIVKKSLTLHGGEIAVHSRPGEGTRFVIHLPLRQAAPAPHKNEQG